jgi:hypothetical protein
VLWIGLPLGIFGYLARWHSLWELLTLILLMFAYSAVFHSVAKSRTHSPTSLKAAPALGISSEWRFR